MTSCHSADNPVFAVARITYWLALVLLVLGLVTTGCHSVYHRARQTLPPDPCAEWKLRVGECREAEKLALAAASRARETWRGGNRSHRLATDLDRVELTGRELVRRAVIADEAAKRCPDGAVTPAALADSMRRHRLGTALADWARAARLNASGDAAPLATLDEILRTDTVP